VPSLLSTHLRLLACTALPLSATAFSALSMLRVRGRVASAGAALFIFSCGDVASPLLAAVTDTSCHWTAWNQTL
jgi:hypothetical protein